MAHATRGTIAGAAAAAVTAAIVVVGAAAGVTISSSAAAWARDPEVNFAGSNSHFAGDCRGQDANLSGSGNTVTIHGGCRAFQIAGGDNRVLVDMAPGGTIKVFGSNNEVSWSSTGEVEVTTVGQDNRVTREQ
jgi:Protein of unknown function (DUF3060)